MKKGITKLFSAIMILLTMCGTALALDGSGTEGDPFQISTPSELLEIDNNMSAYYVLTSDIDLDVSPYNEGNGLYGQIASWSGNGPFTGTIDGQGNTISNLYILETIRDGTHPGSLIGYSKDATFKNLIFENPYSNTSYNDAILSGYCEGTIIVDNVKITGASVGTYNTNYIGGILGEATTVIISNSSFEGTLYGGGGMVGTVYSSAEISQCYSTGQGYGNYNDNIGGLVDWLAVGSNVTITDSYSMMNITESTRDSRVGGGLVADSLYGNLIINNSYYVGTVTDNDGNVSAISNDGVCTETYYNSDFMSDDGCNGSVGKTTVEMQTASTWSAYDTEIWYIEEGSYPSFQRDQPATAPETETQVTGGSPRTGSSTLRTECYKCDGEELLMEKVIGDCPTGYSTTKPDCTVPETSEEQDSSNLITGNAVQDIGNVLSSAGGWFVNALDWIFSLGGLIQ